MLTFITYDTSTGLIETVQQTPADVLPIPLAGKGIEVIDGGKRDFIFRSIGSDYFYVKATRTVLERNQNSHELSTVALVL